MSAAERDAEILVFELDGQRYGLPVEDVREVARAVAITLLPKAPAVVAGIVNVRGKTVPVFDLRGRFRLPPRATSPADHLVIAQAGERVIAFHADRVVGLVHVSAFNVDDPGAIMPGAGYVAGIARLEQGLVLIHDLGTFLSQAEAAALDESLAHPVPAGAAR